MNSEKVSGNPGKSGVVMDKKDLGERKIVAHNEGDKPEQSEKLDPIQESTDDNSKSRSLLNSNQVNVTDQSNSSSTVSNQSKSIHHESNKETASSTTVQSNTLSSPAILTDDDSSQKPESDLSSNYLREKTNSQATLNEGSKRTSGSYQNTNGSQTDSLTSTDGARTPNAENLSKTNLYIRGLPSTTTDEDLYNMCSKFGQIFSTKAIFDKTTGCCRGYGFVQYVAPQSAELAVTELTKSGVQAQMARIPSPYPSHNQHYSHHHHHHYHHNQNQQSHHNNSIGQHRYNHNNGNHNLGNISTTIQSLNSGSNQHNNNADPTNLYIANLGPHMGEHELELLLSAYGQVVSTRILRDERNNPRGVGFARMESKDKCQEIIQKLNGQMCKGAQEPLLIKFADGGNRKRHHNSHHGNSHQHHKNSQDDTRWRESNTSGDMNTRTSYEQQSNIPHNNQMSDLALMSALSYSRMPHSYPPNLASGTGYAAPLGQPSSAHQWLHPGPGHPWNVIPQPMIQPGGLNASNPAATTAAFPYGHIPQLTSQMQGLQIAHHSGAPLGGYLHAHQWPPVWPHHMAAQQHQSTPPRIAPPLQNPQPSQQQLTASASEDPQSLLGTQDGSPSPKDMSQAAFMRTRRQSVTFEGDGAYTGCDEKLYGH